MFKGIFLFELAYRRNRPATYIYFALIFIVCFLLVASPIPRGVGQIAPNSPYVIGAWTIVLSLVFTMISSAVAGVAIVRDFDHHTDAIIFSYSMNKTSFILGRFLGSFFVLVLINAAVPLGLMAGIYVGQFVPWDVAWRGKDIVYFNPWFYLQPFFLFTITNAFVTSALFFMSGALGRSTLIIYTQGILLIILYQLANNFLRDIDSREFAALIDPFGVQTFVYLTRYWTPSEQNTTLVPLYEVLIYNRLMWIGIGVLAIAITCYKFSFQTKVVRTAKLSPKKEKKEESIAGTTTYDVTAHRVATPLEQIVKLSKFYFSLIWKETPFRVIAATGMIALVINATRMTAMYGSNSIPTTHTILTLLNSFNFYLLIIAILYTGELYWRERSDQANHVTDALPVSNSILIASKFIGLTFVYISLLAMLFVSGVVAQAAYGLYNFEPHVYIGALFTGTLTYLLLYTLFSFSIQMVVNNKFLGFALCILLFVIQLVLPELGVEHPLLRFPAATIATFSDMNRYGHFVEPFVWSRIYWLSIAAVVLLIASLLIVRGHDQEFKVRWKTGKLTVTRPWRLTIAGLLVLFAGSGVYIFYNTNVLNTFEQMEQVRQKRIEYESMLSGRQGTQPKIVSASLVLELYPSSRDFTATGQYYLKNKSDSVIREVHVQRFVADHLTLSNVVFEPEARLTESFEDHGYYIYTLSKPLAPADSVRLSFSQSYHPDGFKGLNHETDLVYNGTFLPNAWFPSIGFNRHFDLRDSEGRPARYNPRDTLSSLGKVTGTRFTNLFSDDADRIRLDIRVGTDADQTAVAPGKLKRTWSENGRNYYEYSVDEPTANFYSIVSARYMVRRDRWKNVALEIYYHPGHEFNLDKMIQAMKWALDYHEKNFGAYQFHQLRILEFPRYRTFAQSFPNSIPFSEGIGFVVKPSNPEKDLDVATYVTAHEVAHQWWGHQVIPADTSGGGLLSESLSQYSALMMLKHHFPEEVMQRYLRYELNAYLSGRAIEQGKEKPLASAHRQNYIHYNKASLVFYSLQDYIGEKNLNNALRKFIGKWAYQGPPYPVAGDLIEAIRNETPDSLKHIVKEMFEEITLYENKTELAMYEKKVNGSFEVTLETATRKMKVPEVGAHTDVPVHDWIDIGIYAKDESGKEKLIYLQKHLVTKGKNRFVIKVDKQPSRAGIDPLCKLIDRHWNDNVTPVRQVMEIADGLSF